MAALVEPASSSRFSSVSSWRDRVSSLTWNAAFVRGITAEQMVWGFVILGIVARLLRFLLRCPLWPDEGFLAASLLDRGYLELLEPLEYHQVAPFLYMWAQLTIVKLLGFNEWTLRLFSFVCGISSLLLFRHLAGRLLGGASYVWAVALFAVAYPLYRYSSEAKPYGTDVLVTTLLVTLAVRWWQAPLERRWGWILLAVTPVCIFLSYPAVFVAGGVSLALAAVLVRDRDLRGGVMWIAYNAILIASFAGLYVLSAQKQAASEGYMVDGWNHTFPPRDSIGNLAVWLLRAHTSDSLAYPLGGANFASSLTSLWCLAGAVVLWKKRHFPLALICIAPAALNLIAAAMQRYPYGGHIRFALYAAPLVCLLVGMGAVKLIELLTRDEARQNRIAAGWMAFFALIACGEIMMLQIRPYKTEEFLNARSLAQSLWGDLASHGELVCLKTDLNLEFEPLQFEWGKSCLYLCNQRIYSPRHAEGMSPRWDKVSRDWPLLCVEYRSKTDPSCTYLRQNWLAEMQPRYELVRQTEIPEATWDARGRKREGLSHIVVYEFVPRDTPAALARQPEVAPTR